MVDAASWFATPVGAAIVRAEREDCPGLVAEAYGNFALQFRFSGVDASLLERCGVVARFQFTTDDGRRFSRPVVGNFEDLPVGSNLIQLAVVHHVHQAMKSTVSFFKDVERVLAPGGLLSIHGLNPTGRRLRWRGQMPDWVVAWPMVRTLRQNMRFLGLELVLQAPVFVESNRLERLAGRLARFAGHHTAGWAGSGYHLVYRKPDRSARIIDARRFAARSNAVPKAAPSAGMRPADVSS